MNYKWRRSRGKSVLAFCGCFKSILLKILVVVPVLPPCHKAGTCWMEGFQLVKRRLVIISCLGTFLSKFSAGRYGSILHPSWSQLHGGKLLLRVRLPSKGHVFILQASRCWQLSLCWAVFVWHLQPLVQVIDALVHEQNGCPNFLKHQHHFCLQKHCVLQPNSPAKEKAYVEPCGKGISPLVSLRCPAICIGIQPVDSPWHIGVGNPAMLCMTGFVQTAAVTLLRFPSSNWRGRFQIFQGLRFHEPGQLGDWILHFYQQERRCRRHGVIIHFFRERSEKDWTSKVGKSSPRLQQGSITTPNNPLSTANSSWLPYDSWFDSPIFSQHGSLNHHCSKG